MSNKEIFMNTVAEYFNSEADSIPEGAVKYFNELQKTKETKKAAFTEGGLLALGCFQANLDKEGFKAKEIAEELGVSSRSVSGWCRKLETDGYIEKIGENPAVYVITEEGKNVNVEEEKENLE